MTKRELDAEAKQHEGAHPGKAKPKPKKRRGGGEPRRKGAAAKPPASGGARTPPSPPPVPVSLWQDPPWCRPHLYVCWGFATGDWTPDQLAAKAAAHGAGALMVQHTPENLPYQAEARDACHRHGLAYAIWERSDETLVELSIAAVRELHPDAYLADVEGPMRDPTFPSRFAAWYPDLPKALCATGALDQSYPGTPPEVAAHWIDAGFDLTMQDYYARFGQVNEHQTPDAGENFAYWRGFRAQPAAGGHRHVPVLEVRAEGSPGLADQLPLVKPWGKAVGVYTSEYLQTEDWQALKGLA